MLVDISSHRSLVETLHTWALVRTAPLFDRVALLSVSTLRARHGYRTPIGRLIAVVWLATLGFALGFIHVDFGAEDESASEVVGLLIETAQFALVSAGFCCSA